MGFGRIMFQGRRLLRVLPPAAKLFDVYPPVDHRTKSPILATFAAGFRFCAEQGDPRIGKPSHMSLIHLD